jgi:hypothetical protein
MIILIFGILSATHITSVVVAKIFLDHSWVTIRQMIREFVKIIWLIVLKTILFTLIVVELYSLWSDKFLLHL